MSAYEGALTLAQEHSSGGGAALILPAIPELIWGAVSFVIVYLVLSRIAFPRLRSSVEARERAIRQRQEEAERAKQEADKQLEEYKRRLADARSEANRIIEDARASAEQVRKDIISKAEKDAGDIVQRAQEQMEAERARTLQNLRSTVAEMSIELAEKVVGRSIDGSTQRELVEAYIRDVSGMSTDGVPAGTGATGSSVDPSGA